MSTYTTELRYILCTYAGLDGETGDIDTVITNSVGKLFDPYPIFDETYRAVLNRKIAEHFYFREICTPSAARFRFLLNRTLREVMPYYNQLYESELLKFDPLIDVDVSEVHDGTVKTGREKSTTGNTTTHGETEGNGSKTTDGTASTDTSSDSTENTVSHGSHENKEDRTLAHEGSGTKDGTSKGTKDTAGTSTEDGNTSTTKGLETAETGKQTTSETGTNSNTRTTDMTHTGHSNGRTTSSTLTKESDTPQGELDGLLNDAYLTRAQSASGNGTETKDSTDTDSGTVKDAGSNGKDSDTATTRNVTTDETGSGTEHRTGETSGKETTSGETGEKTAEEYTDTEGKTGSGTEDGTVGVTGHASGTENGRTHGEEVTRESGTSDTVQDTKGDETENVQTLEGWVRHIAGKRGGLTYQEMLMEFRKTFLNIDMMVVHELDTCFMGVFELGM